MSITGGAKLKRRVLVTMAITTLSVLGCLALAVNVSPVFIVGVLFSFVIGAIALTAISCPKCGHTLLFQEQQAFGYRWWSFYPFPIPKVCPNCGRQL